MLLLINWNLYQLKLFVVISDHWEPLWAGSCILWMWVLRCEAMYLWCGFKTKVPRHVLCISWTHLNLIIPSRFFHGGQFLKQEIMNININAKGHKIFLYYATLGVSQRGSLSLSDCFLSPQQASLPHQYTQCIFLVKMASGSLTPVNSGQSSVHIK